MLALPKTQPARPVDRDRWRQEPPRELLVGVLDPGQLAYGLDPCLLGNWYGIVIQGAAHPDRNAWFEHIKHERTAFIRRQQSVIVVDTKKNELVGISRTRGASGSRRRP